VVVMLLPLSLAMDDGDFNHGGGIGCGGCLAAATVAAVVAVDNNWQRKQPATRALGGHGCGRGHGSSGSSGGGYNCRETTAVGMAAVVALWWVGAVALVVAMAVAVAVAVAVVVAVAVAVAGAVAVAVAVVVAVAATTAVVVVVVRVSTPFLCAPALALLPFPFFKSSN
jgi:hypothetical protein